MKLLLHCCCAPCSVSCIDNLRAEKIEPDLFWYNPNIHPYTEYKSRRDCLNDFSKTQNLQLISDDTYNVEFFINETLNKNKSRCEMCYLTRLFKTAKTAKEEGYDAFSTTLLISPYQDHEAIKKTGEDAANKFNIDFFYKDFRLLFKESQSLARAKNLYLQKYCGCIFSEEERYLKIRNDKPGIHNKKNPPLITDSFYERLELLTGSDCIKKLKQTRVLVFGAGGVGSWAAEALVRSCVGKIGIIDNDIIALSNINRQVEATSLTLGLPKASTLKKRLLEINPECEITVWDELFCKENAHIFDIENAGYVIDAIDTINHKLDLIELTHRTKAVLYSSMGMALKMDPLKIKLDSIWKTKACPLARIIRHELRKRNFSGDFNVVYSDEISENENASFFVPGQKRVNGSIVTVTAAAGFALASLVINDVLSNKN